MANKKYWLYVSGLAEASVTVELSEELIAANARDEDGDTVLDLLIEAAAMPPICAQCSGWGRDHSLSIGDNWDWDTASYEEMP